MLVADGIFDALKWASLGAFVLAIAAALLFVPKNVDRHSPTAARVRKGALIVLATIVLLALVGFVVPAFGARVVVVKNGEPSRRTLFGARAYAFQDGHTETIRASSETTIVNDSPTAMRVETQSYGDRGAAIVTHLGNPPLAVPPMTITVSDHRIDFVGPNDAPPPKVEGVYSEERYWLTWSSSPK